MGFFDGVTKAVCKDLKPKYKTMFSRASDYELEEWYEKNRFATNESVQEIVELCEKEMDRRGISY